MTCPLLAVSQLCLTSFVRAKPPGFRCWEHNSIFLSGTSDRTARSAFVYGTAPSDQSGISRGFSDRLLTDRTAHGALTAQAVDQACVVQPKSATDHRNGWISYLLSLKLACYLHSASP